MTLAFMWLVVSHFFCSFEMMPQVGLTGPPQISSSRLTRKQLAVANIGQDFGKQTKDHTIAELQKIRMWHARELYCCLLLERD